MELKAQTPEEKALAKFAQLTGLQNRAAELSKQKEALRTCKSITLHEHGDMSGAKFTVAFPRIQSSSMVGIDSPLEQRLATAETGLAKLAVTLTDEVYKELTAEIEKITNEFTSLLA